MASALSLRGATAPPASGVIPKGAGTRGSSDGRRNLVALGSAAVVAIYAAGFMQTQSAADRFASESAVRRPASSVGGVPQEDPHQTAGASHAVDGATGVERPTTGPVDVPAKGPELAAAAAASASTNVTAGGGIAATPKSPSASTIAANAIAEPSTAPPVVATPAPSAVVGEAASAATAPVASAPVVSAPVVSSPVVSAPVAPVTTAPVSTPAAAAGAPAATPSHAAAAAWRDGFFFGRGTSRHGDIEAMVEIKDGRIMSAVISQCLTRYSCSWIAALPGQVVARQNADVDYVSGATQSANAFYYAIVEALKQAK